MSVQGDTPAIPRVSVLMTIYNAAPFLARSIDSLLAQEFLDWELIAVENGSTDGSAQLLGTYADRRIRSFMLESNIGRTPALRYAASKARAPYIAVLDADDLAHPQRFTKQVHHLDTHSETVLLGTWADYIDERDIVFDEWTPPTDGHALMTLLGSGNPIVHSSSMYRAAVAEEVGGYPEDVPYSQDYGLWLKLVTRGSAAVLPERLCKFRVQAQSMTRTRTYRVDVARDWVRMLTQARRQLTLGREGKRRNREELAIARVRYAVALAKTGRLSAGALIACETLMRNPGQLLNNRITRGFFSK